MTAPMKGRPGGRSLPGARTALLSLALHGLEPVHIHSMQAQGIDVNRCLRELMDLLGDFPGHDGRGNDGAVAEFRQLYRGWAGDMSPRTCSQLLFAVRDALRSRSEGKGNESRAESTAREELFMELIQAAYEEALGSYEEALENCTSALEEIEQFPMDIAAMVDPHTLARSAVSRFFDLTRARCVVLAEVDKLGRLTPVAGTPAGRALFNDYAPSLPEACLQPVLRDGIIVRSPIAAFNPAGEIPPGDEEEALILPLRVRGKTTDVAILASSLTGHGFSELTVRLARQFASRVGVAMENARLHAMEQRKIEETMGLLELARITSSTLNVRQMMKRAAGMLADICRVPMCAVWLKDGGNGRYIPTAWSGDSLDLRGWAVDEHGIPGSELLARGEVALLDVEQAGLFAQRSCLEGNGIKEAVLYPLAVRDSRLGILVFYSDGHLELNGLRDLMETAAGQVAMALENASLYQDIEKSYFCTVKALAKAIEVKDPYTHGHSERVTRFAVALGESMKLGEDELRNLKYAATLHDIGKIGIAGRVLNKGSSLDPEEYEHVKTHPLLGDSIIENVEFLQAPRSIMLHHHERYDGKGYPTGLKGEGIPLEARILAVADAFEAMLSRRPYRMPRSLIEARKELESNAGTQFDPRIVVLFLKMIDENPVLLQRDRKRRNADPRP